MNRYLIYNFPGEADDLSHLFPNERLAQIAAVLKAAGAEAEVWDRGNIRTHADLAPAGWKRSLAARVAAPLFRKLARNNPITRLDKILYGLPLRLVSASMSDELDANYLQFMREESVRIAAGGFRAVFLNLWQGGFDECMKLASWLKRESSVPIYATGQRVDWFDAHILRLFPQIDGLILGLGYESIRRLAAGEAFESLPDVAYRDAKGEIVSTPRAVTEVAGLPAPDYDPAVYQGIEGKIPLYHISLSNQACPNRCSFCPRPYNYGRKVRKKPVEEALKEVESLRARGIRNFRIADSTPPPRMLTDFGRGLIEHGLPDRDAQFTAFARVDQNQREDFDLLRKAGFVSLFFGLETLDDAGLQRIHKGIEYGDIRDTLKAAHDAGLFTVGSLIFPIPDETEASREATFARLKELAPWLDSVLIQPAGVYPISDWGLRPDEFGVRLQPGYIERLMNYRVKFIIPMRFWEPFPFSYPLLGKPAEAVTFDDIRVAFETFSNRVWTELGITCVQDYTLLVARMVGEDPYRFTDAIKEVLVTRNVSRLAEIVTRSRERLRDG